MMMSLKPCTVPRRAFCTLRPVRRSPLRVEAAKKAAKKGGGGDKVHSRVLRLAVCVWCGVDAQRCNRARLIVKGADDVTASWVRVREHARLYGATM